MCAPPPADPVFACDAVGAWIPGGPGGYVQHRVLMTEVAAGVPVLRSCELMCVGVEGPDGARLTLWPGLLRLEIVPAVEGR